MVVMVSSVAKNHKPPRHAIERKMENKSIATLMRRAVKEAGNVLLRREKEAEKEKKKTKQKGLKLKSCSCSTVWLIA